MKRLHFLILLPLFFVLGLMACSSTKEKQTPATPVATTPATTNTQAQTTHDVDVVKKEKCESGSDVRILEVHKTSSGCELNYSKFGQSKVVSSGKYGVKHCNDSFNKITKKLEAQNYKCDQS